MRNAAQCVGRVLRGKTDWGLMVFADKASLCASPLFRIARFFCSDRVGLLSLQRFARADKRAKLPRWINQYITETASNLSTDMALTLSKLFMRTISQNPNENQTGISLWTLDDILKHQAKQKELALEERQRDEPMDEDDEYGDGGLDDSMLAQIDLDI